MIITLRPIDRRNRKAVLALSVREDQPFVATNWWSLRHAKEANAEKPGTARPFGIYADERLVGFCMFAFDPENENPDERYWLWRFMIDQNEQGKGCGQAALQEIIRYFKERGADRLLLSTEPENARGLHVYHKAGFREVGCIDWGEAVLRLWLEKKPKKERDKFLWLGVNVKERLRIREKNGCGVSMAVAEGDGKDLGYMTYCAGSGRYGQNFPVNPDMLFQAGSVSKPMFALTLLRYVDKGKLDLDADISGVVPEFVKKGPVSFAALLSHTAGYNVHGFDGYPAGHAPLSLEDVLSGKGNSPKLRRIRPYGKQALYSGGGITLAELAFTRITGKTLREAFQKEVAKPLKLKRSGFFQPLDEELVENAAFGGRLAEQEDPARGFHYYPEHAAAGFWTTPTELTKIGIALSRSYRKGDLLKQETARRMLTPVMDDYGLCVNNLRYDVGEHGGWNEGFLTEWIFSLRQDLCVASMVNRSNEFTASAQMGAALALFQNREAELAEDAGVDKSGWEAFCGKYEQNDEAFRIDEICLEDEKLWAKVLREEGEQRYELYPIGEKRFGCKGSAESLDFGDGRLTVNGETVCKKLS